MNLLLRIAAFFRVQWAFFRRDALVALSYRLQFFLQMASVLSICVTFFFLSVMMAQVEGQITSLQRYGGRYYGFVLVGIAFSSYLDSALRTFGQAIRQAQMTGTLEAMLSSQTSVGSMVLGSSLYTLFLTTLRAGLFLGFGSLLSPNQLHWEAWPSVVLVLGLTILCTLALGIFSAGFIVLFKQGDPVTGAITGLSWLLSGILYPKEIFPDWAQQAAHALPMTHTLQATRLVLLTDTPLRELQGSLVFLGTFATVGIPTALIWFRWATRRARQVGSLAKY